MTAILVLTAQHVATAAEPPQKREKIETVAAALKHAFVNADAKELKAYFAPKVLYIGEGRFIDPNVMKFNEPTEITAEKLSQSYAKFADRVGKDKWKVVFGKVNPTLKKAEKDGELFKPIKAGDFIYDLHFRESVKGKRNGFDEAVIFVFRKVDGKFKVVAHLNDN